MQVTFSGRGVIAAVNGNTVRDHRTTVDFMCRQEL
jgi:hypothetical protein